MRMGIELRGGKANVHRDFRLIGRAEAYQICAVLRAECLQTNPGRPCAEDNDAVVLLDDRDPHFKHAGGTAPAAGSRMPDAQQPRVAGRAGRAIVTGR